MRPWNQPPYEMKSITSREPANCIHRLRDTMKISLKVRGRVMTAGTGKSFITHKLLATNLLEVVVGSNVSKFTSRDHTDTHRCDQFCDQTLREGKGTNGNVWTE